MQSWFVNNLGNLTFLAIFIFSMLPLTEARVALPFGMSSEVWGDKALSPGMAFLASFLGSTTAGIIVLFLLKPLCNYLKKHNKFNSLVEKLENKFNKSTLTLKLMLFVSLPIPLTGVWSGAGLASFSSIKKSKAVLALTIGNLIATSLILLICLVFKNSILFIVFASVLLILLYLVASSIKKYITKKKAAHM